MSNRDRVFKGATRPAMMFGIPIVPFILIVGTHILVALWSFVLLSGFVSVAVFVLLAFIIVVLRQVNADDNFKLAQAFMYFRDIGYRTNKQYWGTHSMAPVTYKKRKG